MSFELLGLYKRYPLLIHNDNKFYRNKVHKEVIYWCCCAKKTKHCPCIIHTNLTMTKILKNKNNHNHPPSFTKDQVQRQKCIDAISMYEMKVKDAFTTFSINHPMLSINHFTKLSSIKNTIYRNRKTDDGFTVPKTFSGIII